MCVCTYFFIYSKIEGVWAISIVPNKKKVMLYEMLEVVDILIHVTLWS